MDVYVLNKEREVVGIIDNYTSLIWAKRYYDVGDCELYVQANVNTINLLCKDYYLQLEGDDMICRIKKIEIETDAENGNYIIATGYDVKDILNQRIVWTQTNIDGNAESYVRKLLNQSIVNPDLQDRKIPYFKLAPSKGFTNRITEQVTYENLGKKIQELCKTYQWGYRVYLEDGYFYFDLYQGEDKSDFVVFSPEYENLISTDYVEDSTNNGNIVLVGGTGEGSDRATNVSGSATGIDRYEIFVDAKSTSNNITYKELTTLYPLEKDGGQGYLYITGTDVSTYRMRYLDIAIMDNQQLSNLMEKYPNGIKILVNGVLYYRIKEVKDSSGTVTKPVIIADIKTKDPQDDTTTTLRDIVYSLYLLNLGYEKLAEYGTTTTFDGSIEPNSTFKYNEDYYLGDVVTVENEYGITLNARIVEVIETYDENGHTVDPKFEYLNVNESTQTYAYLLNENDELIEINENNDILK